MKQDVMQKQKISLNMVLWTNYAQRKDMVILFPKNVFSDWTIWKLKCIWSQAKLANQISGFSFLSLVSFIGFVEQI